jgi:hypothetical protein
LQSENSTASGADYVLDIKASDMHSIG